MGIVPEIKYLVSCILSGTLGQCLRKYAPTTISEEEDTKLVQI